MCGTKRGSETLPQADDKQRAGGLEPAADKRQDKRRRAVEPLDVIGDHNDRPIAGDLNDQIESGKGDQKHFGCRTGSRSERRQQGGFWGVREAAG